MEREAVTEIFIRINSRGIVLNQADFAISVADSSGQRLS